MNGTTPRVLIVGGTGLVGGTIRAALSARGVEVRATTRSRTVCETPGLEWSRLDVSVGPAPARLFTGIQRAFLMAPTGYVDQYSILSPMILAATRAGVERIVLMTAQGVDGSAEIPFRKAELQLRDAGVRYAILRPAWFMQNFHTFWGEDIRRRGLIALPGGTGKVVFVDTRDVAAVAEALLMADTIEDCELDVTGHDVLNYGQAAAILSVATGQTIGYEDADPAQFLRRLIADRIAPEYAALIGAMFDEVRLGAPTCTTENVQRLTGRPPRSLFAYGQDHREQLRRPRPWAPDGQFDVSIGAAKK